MLTTLSIDATFTRTLKRLFYRGRPVGHYFPRFVQYLSFIPIIAGMVSPLSAQTPTATLIGVVRDPAGLPVPNSQAIILNSSTGDSRRLLSGADGVFTAPSLPRGIYEVRIEKEGFQALRQTGIELHTAQAARMEFQLQVGSVVQVVDVEARAPVVNTENATRGEIIGNLEITQMPLPGRSFSDLAYLVPGVSPSGDGAIGSGLAVNGARADNAMVLIDGVQARNAGTGVLLLSANLESVEEFKMMTNNYSAEYGQFAGGVMNLALKSGSNQFHGSAFEFARDAVFDARSFFAAQKGDLRRNQYGGSFNGPVRIPRLYDGRNRTFFLFSWDRLRQTTPRNDILTVPTELQRRGDFSETRDVAGRPVVLRDPYGVATAVYPGAQIPAAQLDAIALKVAEYWPRPSRPGPINNYLMNHQVRQTSQSMTIKIEQYITSRDRLSFHLARSFGNTNGLLANAVVETFAFSSPYNQPVAGLTYSRTMTPGLMLDMRLGMARSRAQQVGAFSGRITPAELGIPGLTTAPDRLGFPQFAVSGLAQVGDTWVYPNSNVSNSYQTSASLTWVKGRHIIKTGGEMSQLQWFTTGNGFFSGMFNFLGRWTSEPYADFLLGLPESTRRNVRENRTYAYANHYNFFVQDDFKLSPRVTVNLGLRYELLMPTNEKHGHWASFLPEFGKTVVASEEALPNLKQDLAAAGLTDRVTVASAVGVPKSLVYTNALNFAPRLGIAWRPFGGNRTAVRAGWGIFYGSNYLTPVAQLFGDAYPNSIVQDFVRVATDPTAVTLSNPFQERLARISGTVATQGYELHGQTPYLQSFNFTVERELGSSTAVELAYSGSKGTNLSRSYNINQPYYFQRERHLPNGTIPTPYTGWGNINYFSFGANSHYHSAIATLRKRIARGLFYRVNYVYGKAIDTASTYWHTTAGGYNGAADSRNLGLERGRADFDVRHSLTFNFSWDVPSRSRWIGGWQLAGTGRAYTGQPYTLRTSLATLARGESDRPDRIRTGTLENPTVEAWFDRTAFPLVAAGAFHPGTAGRNILDAPGSAAVNFALMRNFKLKLRERDNLQFRWEAFNALNRANFLTPNVFVNDRNGGTITRTQQPRSMQFAIRYSF